MAGRGGGGAHLAQAQGAGTCAAALPPGRTWAHPLALGKGPGLASAPPGLEPDLGVGARPPEHRLPDTLSLGLVYDVPAPSLLALRLGAGAEGADTLFLEIWLFPASIQPSFEEEGFIFFLNSTSPKVPTCW